MDPFIVFLIILAGFMFAGFYVWKQRLRVRHWLHDRREATIGELVWSEVVHEGSNQQGQRTKRITPADVSGLLSLNSSVKVGGFWPYRQRGVISYVWYRKEDGSIHLYVGVSRLHYGDGSAIKVAAAALDATLVRQDSPPPVPSASFAIARRGRAIPSSIAQFTESKGALAESVSSAMNGIPAQETAAVVITMEPMYNGESKRLAADIVESESMNTGQASIHAGIASQAGIMVSRAMRTTIAASTSIEGDATGALSLLNSATGGIPSLGWQITSKAYSGSSVHPGMASRLRGGEVVIPPFVWFNPRWFLHGNWRSNKKEAGSDQRVGGRTAPPSTGQVLYLYPVSLYEAVSFPDRFSASGVDVHKDTTLSRGIPSSMVDVQYPLYWGTSGTGQFISQDLSDLHYPMYCAGAPGTGKTNFLQVIFAGVVKASIERTAGLQITPFWGETKGEGAEDAWLIARRHPRAVFVDTHNPLSRYRLALEGPRIADGATVDQITRNVSNLVSGLQFAWGDGIRSASRELLDQSIRIAMLLDANQIDFLELGGYVNAEKPNVMDLSFMILGGNAQIQPGAKLLQISDEAHRTGDVNTDPRMNALCGAIDSISRFLDPKGRKEMTQQISSPLNKLSDLRSARLAWEPNERIDFYPQSIPSWFAPIVLNMGPYRQPDGNYSSISNAISRRLLLITNYLIWDTIKSNCSGWQAQGKRVNLFFDEVADIAVDSQSDDVMNVLADANKEGRSRGTAYYVGCQSPAQMPYQARHSVLGSRTKFWFGLHESDDLRLAVNDLASGDQRDQPYTQENIRGIPDGSCVGIMKRKSTVTSAFTLNVPYAAKWAEFLLRPGVTVDEAIVDYYQWVDQNPREIQLAFARNDDVPVEYAQFND